VKKILLFSRNDLVNLYGELSNQLKGKVECIHLAYSAKEVEILKSKYQISDVINFKDEISNIFQAEQLNPEIYNEIDNAIIEQTEGRFCLNSAIQSDRTFSFLTYEQCLLMTQVYFKFWKNLIEKEKFEVMLHEPVALFLLQIASVLCKQNRIQYVTQINVFGKDKYNWIFVSAENGFPVEMVNSENKPVSGKNKTEIDAFLNDFRAKYDLIFPQIASKRSTNTNYFKLLLLFSKIILSGLKNKLIKKKSDFTLPLEHIEFYLNNNKTNASDKLKNRWDEVFHLKYDPYDSSKKYYYYPMHMEPEAVVLYWGDGLYKNQIKLIENIAAQLPPNHFLYVKVHPIVKEERYYIDYKKLQSIPNVKLIGPEVPGRMIIKNAMGLMTINGTSGFEAVLLNKPVYVFGNSFYDLSDRVTKIKNIRDARASIYESMNNTFTDDENLYQFINAFMGISHEGFTGYYVNYTEQLGIEHKSNVEKVAKGVLKYILYNEDSVINH
jgi:hypothetical protein